MQLKRISGRLLTVLVLSLTPLAVLASPALALHVSGNHLVDASGEFIQLRGVNVSGLEFVAAQGWSPGNPWGGATGDPTPNWGVMKTWRINVVRIPLNEASWLGSKCKNAKGELRDPDAGHNYRQTVTKAIDDATTAGFYVILDLHWTAPNGFCPLAQNPMADQDNSRSFWGQVAGQYKDRPNVVFEAFNEPYFSWLAPGEIDWTVLRDGGTFTQYVTGDGARYTSNYSWQALGMQAIVDTIRATGAKNVILIGSPSWCQDLSQWLRYRPRDPFEQIAAVWHAYPNAVKIGDPKSAEPKLGLIAYTWVQGILDAGYPVVITEFGDHNAPGSIGSPFASKLLPWADKAGVSYLGWTWDLWQDHDNVLIKSKTGTPSDGYGEYVKQHYLCAAERNATCR